VGTRLAPCALCARKTTHNILAMEDRGSEEGSDKYYFLTCAGCGSVSMENFYDLSGDPHASYYPSPISRKVPDWSWKLTWFTSGDEEKLGELFEEIYKGVQGKQYRLAAMGIRAFIEQLMVLKVGDHGTFEKNLDAFFAEGYISKIHRKALSLILDSGHAVIHRMHKPTEADLNIALDILESVTAAIYFHEEDAKKVAARVKPRSKT
jgi:hypothetical protein